MAVGLTAAVIPLLSQTARKPSFEVVSIKPRGANGPRGGGGTTGDRYTGFECDAEGAAAKGVSTPIYRGFADFLISTANGPQIRERIAESAQPVDYGRIASQP